MKPFYLLFVGETYYPQKGIDDLVGLRHATLKDAVDSAFRINQSKKDGDGYDWWQVVYFDDGSQRVAAQGKFKND